MKPISRVDTFILVNLVYSVTLSFLYVNAENKYREMRKRFDELMKKKGNKHG
jgi:hypothetical protein